MTFGHKNLFNFDVTEMGLSAYITVLLFIFIKMHMKNNESMQNYESMESSRSKLEDYVKRFDQYFMSLE